MKINLVLRQLHRSESQLAHRLNVVSARHKTEQDIYHLAHDLAQWSQSHLEDLAHCGRRYGVRLAAKPRTRASTAALQHAMSALVRKRPEPALLLLADLRRIHTTAAGVSLDWEMLAQAAQAAKDQQLLELCQSCHPETLRQLRWSNAMVKELSAQTLVS